MKYHYRRTTRHTVRLAFELTNPYHEKPRQVWRIRDDHGTHSFKHEGIVLEHSKKQTRVAVVNVRTGDIVMVTYHAGNAGTPPHQGYRIAETFEPIPIDDVIGILSNMSLIETRPARIEMPDDAEMYFDKAELQLFMRAKHPRWLADHVNETLRSWRDKAINSYVNNAPREWLDPDILILAAYAPQRALTDFRHRLTPEQKASCIRRLVFPKTDQVLDKLPHQSIRFKQGATYVLQNHLHALTNAELRRCAKADPVTAYRSRHLMTDDRRAAILLATTFGVAWHTDRHTLGRAFRKEIFVSLTQYPDEWLKSNPGYSHIFGRLDHLLGICFGAKAIALMLRRMAPANRGPLRLYIAASI
jgi:hypothetical protein